MERATLLSDISVLLATVLRGGEHITHEDLLRSKFVTVLLREPALSRTDKPLIGTTIGENS
jgi:hypothetical protein